MTAERKIINKAKKGDNRAFGDLYDTYVAPIYRFIIIRTGNKSDAEDLTHQVFLSAWQNIKNYDFKGFPFSSWLYRIAHNAVIDFYRTNRRHTDIDSIPDDTLSHEPDFGGKVDNLIRVNFIRAAIKDLDEDQQSVIVMKFINELSNKEISDALGKSEGAVRVIQHRALKRLRSQIDEKTRFN